MPSKLRGVEGVEVDAFLSLSEGLDTPESGRDDRNCFSELCGVNDDAEEGVSVLGASDASDSFFCGVNDDADEGVSVGASDTSDIFFCLSKLIFERLDSDLNSLLASSDFGVLC